MIRMTLPVITLLNYVKSMGLSKDGHEELVEKHCFDRMILQKKNNRFIQRLLKMYFFIHLRTILQQIEFCFGKNKNEFSFHLF